MASRNEIIVLSFATAKDFFYTRRIWRQTAPAILMREGGHKEKMYRTIMESPGSSRPGDKTEIAGDQMNTNKLSKRLEAVAKHIPENSSVADIGSDHAYLPCHLAKKGRISFAIAGEVAEGPFQSALSQVQSEGLTNRIAVRKGDGLDVIEPGEVACITIAGMGGPLIASILERGKSKLEGVTKLVLQPNIGAFAIREWLLKNGWKLAGETILREDGKIYEVLSAVRGIPEEPYSDTNREAEILFGPYLMKEKNEAFREKWGVEIQNWKKILEQLEHAGESEATFTKRREMQGKIRMAEEVLS